MPIARIEVRKNRSPEQVQAIFESVYQAQREAMQLPERDRQIRYIEHRPEHFRVPSDKGENYTIVEIAPFSGRSHQAKCALYQAIIKRFEALGIAASDVVIVLGEVPLDNWGIRGGKPASEVDLGFKVNVQPCGGVKRGRKTDGIHNLN